MFEAVVTTVALDVEDGNVYPITKVYRIAFETEDQFLLWLAAAESHGAVHQERMTAER